MLVLERKISMRKPREELVKRGVLLEDPEQGEFANSICLSLYTWSLVLTKYLNFLSLLLLLLRGKGA